MVYTTRVLGDPHGINDGRPLCLAVHQCGLPQLLRRDAADALHHLRGVLGHHLLHFVKSLGAVGNELIVGQALTDDDVHHAVQPGDVAARPLAQP